MHLHIYNCICISLCHDICHDIWWTTYIRGKYKKIQKKKTFVPPRSQMDPGTWHTPQFTEFTDHLPEIPAMLQQLVLVPRDRRHPAGPHRSQSQFYGVSNSPGIPWASHEHPMSIPWASMIWVTGDFVPRDAHWSTFRLEITPTSLDLL